MSTSENSSQEIIIKPVICDGLNNVPNAWGHQKYSGEYFKVSVDNQRDVNNNLASYGTLRDFVIRHIEGIKLKEKQKATYCKNCTCGAGERA